MSRSSLELPPFRSTAFPSLATSSTEMRCSGLPISRIAGSDNFGMSHNTETGQCACQRVYDGSLIKARAGDIRENVGTRKQGCNAELLVLHTLHRSIIAPSLYEREEAHFICIIPTRLPGAGSNSFDELSFRSTHLDLYLHYLQFLCNVATHRYGLAGAARRCSIGKCNPSLCQSFVCVSSTLPRMSEVVARRWNPLYAKFGQRCHNCDQRQVARQHAYSFRHRTRRARLLLALHRRDGTLPRLSIAMIQVLGLLHDIYVTPW